MQTVRLKQLFKEASEKYPIKVNKVHTRKSQKTGFDSIFLVYCSSCRQKFMFQYRYREDGKNKAISSINLSRLKEKMEQKGFKFIVDDPVLARETVDKFGGI